MTIYVYEVRSDRPMSAYVGIGNVAVLTFNNNGGGIIDPEATYTVASNGAATGAGTFTVKLKERAESEPKALGTLRHQHETWQIRTDGRGGRYCAACGATV